MTQKKINSAFTFNETCLQIRFRNRSEIMLPKHNLVTFADQHPTQTPPRPAYQRDSSDSSLSPSLTRYSDSDPIVPLPAPVSHPRPRPRVNEQVKAYTSKLSRLKYVFAYTVYL